MKSKYETVVQPNLKLVEAWCRDGLSDREISERLGIAYSTFRIYKEKYSALSASLKKTKDIVDSEVVGALFKRALGYEVTEWEETYDGQGNLIAKKKKIRHIPPDPTSMNFWLTHRQRMNWGAPIEAVDSNTGGVVMIPEKAVVEVDDGKSK